MLRACKVLASGVIGLLLLAAGATAIADVLIGEADPPDGQFIETSAGREHVLDVGPDFAAPDDAPAMVLLHGATANLEDMRFALADRLRVSYRVIAVDRPGSGWSERMDGAADADPHRQAEILHEILQKTGVQRPILVAHSWAGSVALDYALAYPGQLSALLLLAPVAYRWSGDITEDAKLATTPVLGPCFVHTVALPIAWAALDHAVTLAFEPNRPPPDYIDQASILLGLRTSAITASVQDLAQMDAFPTPQSLPYAGITIPTVIIAGTDDHVVPTQQQARVLARKLPRAHLIMLPGVGHMPHYAAPERVLATIAALVDLTRPDADSDHRD